MRRQDYDHKTLQGQDASLKTSLKEYGFAWIETADNYLFYYGIQYSGQEGYCKFDFAEVEKFVDIKEEFDWVDWEEFKQYVGMDLSDCTIPQQYADLLHYYGFENVFGSSYWEGLTFEKVVRGEL